MLINKELSKINAYEETNTIGGIILNNLGRSSALKEAEHDSPSPCLHI